MTDAAAPLPKPLPGLLLGMEATALVGGAFVVGAARVGDPSSSCRFEAEERDFVAALEVLLVPLVRSRDLWHTIPSINSG